MEEIVPYYKYVPQPVLEDETTLLYWNRPIITDQTIPNYRIDIVIVHRTEKNSIFINITCPADHNLCNAETEKITKYRDLAIEFQKIHRLHSVTVIPIVVSVNGLMTKNIKQYLKKLNIETQI